MNNSIILAVFKIECEYICCVLKNKSDNLKEIESILQDMGVQMVSYEMWTNQDRCKVASFCKPPADFARFLVGKLEEFATHVYVDKNQSHHIKSLQKTVTAGTRQRTVATGTGLSAQSLLLSV